MAKQNDLSRCLVSFEQDATVIARPIQVHWPLPDILQCRAISVAIGSIADIGYQPGLGHSVANDPEPTLPGHRRGYAASYGIWPAV